MFTLDLKCGGFLTGLMTIIFSPAPFLHSSSAETFGSGGSSTIFGCVGLVSGLLSTVGVDDGDDFDLACIHK